MELKAHTYRDERVSVKPVEGCVRVMHSTFVVAESVDTYAFFFGSALMGYLVPEQDVNHDLLVFSDTQINLLQQPTASFLSLYVDDVVWKDVAWRYDSLNDRLTILGSGVVFASEHFDVFIDNNLQPKTEAAGYVWRSDDDKAVVQQIGEGSQCAVRLLYDRFHNAVFALAKRIVEDDELAKDVMQQVFLELHSRSDQWDAERGRLSTWILTITRYTAIDALHKRSRLADAGFDDFVLDKITASKVDGDVIDWDTRIALATAVSELELIYREVVEAVFLKGLTHRQAAEKLGLPLGTVKTRVRKAITLLQAHWGDDTRMATNL